MDRENYRFIFFVYYKKLYICSMDKNYSHIKTKLLKKLKKSARKRYKFEEVYTRNEQKQSVPLYRVLDMIYDYDDCYRVQKETTNREEAWSFYISKYREFIFEKLDDYYRYCNKTPKSIRKSQETRLTAGIIRPTIDFLVRDEKAMFKINQKSNKIKIN